MKLSVKLKFASDNVIKNFKKFLISVFVLTISLILVLLAVMMYSSMRSGYKTLDRTLKNGIENTAVLIDRHSNGAADKSGEILSQIYALPEVEAAGNFQTYSIKGSDFDRLNDIQKSGKKEYINVLDSSFEVIVMPRELFALCNLQTEQGELPDRIKSDDGYTRLYLGHGFAGKVKIGEVFKNDAGEKCIVAGFFKEGSKWVNDDVFTEYNMFVLDYSEDMEYKAVEISPLERNSTNVLTFSVKKGCDIDDVMKKADKIASKNSDEYTLQTMEKVCQNGMNDTHILLDYLTQIMGVILVSAMIMMICLQTVSVISEKSTYGIYYAIGFSERDITQIVVLENIIKMLTAFIITTVVGLFAGNKIFEISDINREAFNSIFWAGTVPVVFAVAAAVTAISVIVPIYILKHYSAAELIGDKND